MKTYIPATEADRRAALARIEARRAAVLLELEELDAMQESHRAALTGRPMLAQVEALPFEQVRLTLADGQAVMLDLEALPAPCCARCRPGRCCSKTGRTAPRPRTTFPRTCGPASGSPCTFAG